MRLILKYGGWLEGIRIFRIILYSWLVLDSHWLLFFSECVTPNWKHGPLWCPSQSEGFPKSPQEHLDDLCSKQNPPNGGSFPWGSWRFWKGSTANYSVFVRPADKGPKLVLILAESVLLNEPLVPPLGLVEFPPTYSLFPRFFSFFPKDSSIAIRVGVNR